MRKKTIKLTESQLKRIIENTINEKSSMVHFTLMDENDEVIQYLESDDIDKAKIEAFDILSERMGFSIMTGSMERQTGTPTTTIRKDINLPSDYNLD